MRHKGHSKPRAEGEPKLVKVRVHVGAEPKSRCCECMKMRVTATAIHLGAGSYRRAVRRYRAQICLGCIRTLLGRVTPGHSVTEMWDVASLKTAQLTYGDPYVDPCTGIPESNLLPPERVALERARAKAKGPR